MFVILGCIEIFMAADLNHMKLAHSCNHMKLVVHYNHMSLCSHKLAVQERLSAEVCTPRHSTANQ